MQNDEDNAAFIVRACNGHDALVKALEEAQGVLETLFIGWECKAENRGKALQESPYIALGAVRAALNLSKEA